MKNCFKCGNLKTLDCFYRHNQMTDGHLNKCKDCTKNDVRNYYFDNHDKCLKANRIRNRKPKYVEQRKAAAERWKADPELRRIKNESQKQWIKRNTLKRAAHILVANAVRDGRLIKQPCCVCGLEKSEAHHEDYEKPLDVMWLCRKHHAEIHRKPTE